MWVGSVGGWVAGGKLYFPLGNTQGKLPIHTVSDNVLSGTI